MYQMCATLPVDLGVEGDPDCWILDFRDWVLSQGKLCDAFSTLAHTGSTEAAVV